MEMPKPTEHHRKYQALVGEWSGEEKLHPMPWSPQAAAATSHCTYRLDLDGFFLICDHEQTRDGKVSYRGHGVFGHDPRQQKHTMHWFDVMGGDPGAPATGTWQGDTLSFQHSHHMGHSRYTYRFERDGFYDFRIEMSQDGKNWMPFLDGAYKRVSK